MTSRKIGHFLTPPPPYVTLGHNKVDPPMKMTSQIANPPPPSHSGPDRFNLSKIIYFVKNMMAGRSINN